MRRAPIVVSAAAAGLAGVLAFHPSTPPSILSAPPAKSAPQGASGPPATSPPPVASGGTRSAVGTDEQFGYGALSVKVTVQGSRITGLAVASLQTAESYSQSIATQVIPILHGEVLSAQSARINAVSGATYTSEAYAYSIQSALDKLGVK